MKVMSIQWHQTTSQQRCNELASEPNPRLQVSRSVAVVICGLLLLRAPAPTSVAAESVQNESKSTAQPPLVSLPASQPDGLPTDTSGYEACLPCHQDKVNTYLRTAHHLTSSWPRKDSIHGNFNAGDNILTTRSTNVFFRMEARDNGFFQTAVVRDSPTNVQTHTERFDVVFGSGRKGQTYLYWHHNRRWDRDELYELPVSYWVERDVWMNSPGLVEFPDGSANFTRPVTQRCLECHTTSFEWLSPLGDRFNQFNKSSLVLGIGCEKCHGSGTEHIARYRSASPPTSPNDAAIVNPARLPRDRQMDVCALCHAGIGHELAPALTFKPGDVLSNALEVALPGRETKVDVHGNQTQLLERSRCFQSSPKMNCFTCHDVHQPQRDIKAMASSCLTCHHVESCGKFPELGQKINGQCVVCHMPLQQTDSVLSSAEGLRFQPKVRNHQIGIYPEIQLP